MNLSYLIGWAGLLSIPLVLAACDPSSSQSGAINLQQLKQQAQLIIKNKDLVKVDELADWIIRDTRDFDVIDIRNSGEYQASHIKNAMHLDINSLLSKQGLAQLAGYKKQLIYSASGQRSAQVVTLLRLSGINAYSLQGGYQQWLRYTTDPDSFNSPTQGVDASARARQQAVACYFEGDYVAAAGLMVKPLDAGFTPPLTPVQSAESVEEVADPLGLGLGLGDEDVTEPMTEEAESTGLVLGEGC